MSPSKGALDGGGGGPLSCYVLNLRNDYVTCHLTMSPIKCANVTCHITIISGYVAKPHVACLFHERLS